MRGPARSRPAMTHERIMRMTRSPTLRSPLLLLLLVVTAAPALARSSTEAPVPSRGKLGQDLFLAVAHRDLAGVKALLKRGADPNARNGLEFAPLYIAAASGQPEVMAALLQAGAKLQASSPYGTALSVAAEAGSVPSLKLLHARCANAEVLRA